MIKIEHLKKSFSDGVLFQDLNLEIKDGEFVVFSGKSGCGKTTLLNMIGSLESYDAGKITVNGLDIGVKRNQRKYLREEVGFVFQNFALVEEKTVKENLKLINKGNSSGMSMEEALEKVGLSNKINAKIYSLSGGEQQRVALARVLMKKCSIVLCDEPTGSLDRTNGDAVIDIIKTMHSSGKTIIMVTHDEKYKNCGERLITL
ncbi:MAG: ABC transporter ATP-binding protein [Oscillospiraceae bacterium]|nr:ABC transporter ATP-binding protein [Oscillospiraceae bacterium]